MLLNFQTRDRSINIFVVYISETLRTLSRASKQRAREPKEARTAKKQEAAAQMDAFAEGEGILYSPGIAD